MSTHRIALLGSALLVAIAAQPIWGDPVNTAIRVTTTADDVVIDGNCSLREAIIAANTDTAIDRCPAGSGTDSLLVPEGTYTLSRRGPNEDAAATGDLDILGDVYIFGVGAGKTVISGGAFDDSSQDRVFHVLSGGQLTLYDVTVRDGICRSGGGIYNAGTLRIGTSVVSNNIARESSACGSGGGGGGVYNLGSFVLYRSTISVNRVQGYTGLDVEYPGGGLLTSGSALLRYSTVTGNYAAGGGGIWNGGQLEVSDSQLSHNGARFWGAGLENVAGSATFRRSAVYANNDGGIVNGHWTGSPATLTLLNSTVSGNTSYRVGGAIYNFAGPVEITYSTIAGNISSQLGAGIGGQVALVRLGSSIVSNGSQGDCSGPLVSLGYNVASDTSCGLTVPSDLSNTDPQLGDLADNGGPTPTRALNAGSPAIDRIAAGGCGIDTDQRGVARVTKDPCDSGAYERSPFGDILLLTEEVKGLWGDRIITAPTGTALLSALKPAAVATARGEAATACTAIGEFASLVSELVNAASLPPVEGRHLLDGASRVEGLICP